MFPGYSLGLVAFGRQQNPARPGCDDIDLLADRRQLGATPENSQDFQALVTGLADPRKGQTPLIDSIERAAEQLPDGGTITVVSDFVETCSESRFAPLAGSGDRLSIAL